MREIKMSRRNLLAFLSSAIIPSVAVANPTVDLALVLAIDCSYSVDDLEYRLQMRGLGQAFLDSQMLDLISRGGRKKIAVAAFHWSDALTQQIIVPWQILQTAKDAIQLADLFLSAPRTLSAGATDTGAALLYAQKLFEVAPAALRKVVDVSTDGKGNGDTEIEKARDKLVASGITVNGLAIVNEEPNLVSYLYENMIGGDDSFVIAANDFNAYSAAIRQKLYKEITNINTI
jgi:Protein of unknown function (DUF1194)